MRFVRKEVVSGDFQRGANRTTREQGSLKWVANLCLPRDIPTTVNSQAVFKIRIHFERFQCKIKIKGTHLAASNKLIQGDRPSGLGFTRFIVPFCVFGVPPPGGRKHTFFVFDTRFF